MWIVVGVAMLALFVVGLFVIRRLMFKGRPVEDRDGLDFGLMFFFVVMWAGLVLMISYVPFSFTGLLPGYSNGVREGYLTKVSTKGVFFKTVECELQIGTGEQAALQQPFAFSVRREDEQRVQALLGRRVRMTYSQWMRMPVWIGDSDYELKEIEAR